MGGKPFQLGYAALERRVHTCRDQVKCAWTWEKDCTPQTALRCHAETGSYAAASLSQCFICKRDALPC